jgi:hypothetical protein
LAAADEADLDAWRSRLGAADVDFWEERHGDQRSVYFSDPDGVILEITWPASNTVARERPQALETVQRWLAEAKAAA